MEMHHVVCFSALQLSAAMSLLLRVLQHYGSWIRLAKITPATGESGINENSTAGHNHKVTMIAQPSNVEQ
eukprot:1604441-Rhodomonas_salina.1